MGVSVTIEKNLRALLNYRQRVNTLSYLNNFKTSHTRKIQSDATGTGARKWIVAKSCDGDATAKLANADHMIRVFTKPRDCGGREI